MTMSSPIPYALGYGVLGYLVCRLAYWIKTVLMDREDRRTRGAVRAK